MFDKVKDFFQSDFFDARWKGKVFAAQVGVTTLAFILGIAKLATRPSYVPMSRMDIMAITMVCHRNRFEKTSTNRLDTEHQVILLLSL